MRELIKEIWSTSKRNKLRTSLTGFAVAWGIFMLIFLLGAGNGLINAQLQQSTRFLANSMRVFPGETSKAYKGLKEGRSITLNDKDILISNKTYGQYVDDVGGRLEQYNVNINYGDNYVASQSLVGVAPTHPKIDKTEPDCRTIHQRNRYEGAAQECGAEPKPGQRTLQRLSFAGGQERKDQQPQLPGGGNLQG